MFFRDKKRSLTFRVVYATISNSKFSTYGTLSEKYLKPYM
jgi:hypothetical protein